MMTRIPALSVPIILVTMLSACSPEPSQDGGGQTIVIEDPATSLQQHLQDASPGTVLELPAGEFRFQRSLTLNADRVTLRGAGIDNTILSFADQVAGAEGLLVNADRFTIEDLAIEDTRGDALKITRGEHIVVRGVRTEWNGEPDADNGAYGIYPVQTRHTLIEDSVAIGASDAGIYIGQSENVVVRNNHAEFNVAGIEIENTVGADVHGNLAANNTGGILVFNMPNLPQEGHSTRVFDNRIMSNNTVNFAAPGTAVASVPSGSGVIINSNDRVEIFDNDIAGNRTANILISSYFSAGYEPREQAESFDPYPETIFIHDNRFGGGGRMPQREELERLRLAMFGEDGRLPDIVWDGIRHPERSATQYAICVDNGDARLLNMDAGSDETAPDVDMSRHQCRHEPLPAVQLPSSGSNGS